MEKSGYLIGDLMQDYTKKGLPYFASLNTFLSIPKKERDQSSVEELIWKLRPLFETNLQIYKTKIEGTKDTIKLRIKEMKKAKSLEKRANIKN